MVYIDNDPIVLAHALLLSAPNGSITHVQAELTGGIRLRN